MEYICEPIKNEIKDEKTSWEEILSFWFDGNLEELHRNKWFISDKNHETQKTVDAYISTHFTTIVESASLGLLDHWMKQPLSFVALLIVLDQFPRHLYRMNIHHHLVTKTDEIALQKAWVFIQQHPDWLQALDTPYFIFVLMPLRHNNPSSFQLQKCIDLIIARQERTVNGTLLLDKFLQTTIRRLSDHENGKIQNDNTVDGFSHDDLLERIEVPTSEAQLRQLQHLPVYTSLLHYMDTEISKDCSTNVLLVSLSGGVDSMVLAFLFKEITKTVVRYSDFQVVAIHIDYGNRNESRAEATFVEEWCLSHDILFRMKRISKVSRKSTKRDEYERIAKEIRYAFYETVLFEFNGLGIGFGHHLGDVQENVLSNLMKGSSVLELNGMKRTSLRNGITIWRPLLNHTKEDLFNLAHTYGIPYFKDTTPCWSIRGKLRNTLLPLLQDIYGKGVLNHLSTVGKDANECQHLVSTSIFTPCVNNIIISNMGLVLPCIDYVDYGKFFWKEILRKVCHDLLGCNMIRDSPMDLFIQKLQQRNTRGQWLSLKASHSFFMTSTLDLLVMPPSSSCNVVIGQDIQVVEHGQSTLVPNKEWKIELELVENKGNAVLKTWTTCQVIATGGITYYIPSDGVVSYIISNKERMKQIRQVEKKVTDTIPLVIARDENNKMMEKMDGNKLIFVSIHRKK